MRLAQRMMTDEERQEITYPTLACPDSKLAELVSRWEGRPQSDAEQQTMRDRLAVWLMALDECGVGDDPTPHVAFFENFLEQQRNSKHSGDCNNKPWSCCRCICDEFLEKADQLLSAFPALTQPT